MPGKVVFDDERCKGCEICVLVCPRKIIGLGDRRNARGYRTAVVREMDRCAGCAICAQMCPDVAIEVHKLDAPGKKAADAASPKGVGC